MNSMKPMFDGPIAIVGVGTALPGASSPEELWDVLCQGEPVWKRDRPADLIGFDDFFAEDPDAPDRSYSKIRSSVSTFLPHPSLQRESAAGCSPSSLAAMWLRHSLYQALETIDVRERRCVLTVGISATTLNELEQALVVERAARQLGPGTFGPRDGLERVRRVLATRYPLPGAEPHRLLPQQVVWEAQYGLLPAGSELVCLDAACSAGLLAVEAGINALLAGEADLALCSGVNTVTASEDVAMAKVGGVSASGQLRAFDVRADGSVFGEGAAAVALKTLERALDDGDDVLAVIVGWGTSSDGKGTGIFTPDGTGQQLAVQRARAVSGTAAEDVDWMIAHAIGIPMGDAIEFSSIKTLAAPTKPCPVTSFKSLLGHPSYAAGVVGVINAVLGLQHGSIPAQGGFDAMPAGYADSRGGGEVYIPNKEIPLPGEPGRDAVVGVSCFGFGGANGHLVITGPGGQVRHRPPDMGRQRGNGGSSSIVLVGWGAHLPGTPSRAELITQIRSGNFIDAVTFGDLYPFPHPAEVGLPPVTQKRVGRSHPMMLQSVNDLIGVHGAPWRNTADTTGVFIGFPGPTGKAVDYQTRIHLSAVRNALERSDEADAEVLSQAFDQYAERVRSKVKAVDEDTIIALLGNCIAARVSKRFGLRGPTLTVDQGLDSVFGAARLAIRALCVGSIDVALVGGLSCHPGHEYVSLLKRLVPGLPAIAEGAFALALTTESMAAANGLDVLARIESFQLGSETAGMTLRSGPAADRTYWGADGAVALLRAALLDQPTPCLVLPHGGPLGAADQSGLAVNGESRAARLQATLNDRRILAATR